MGNNNGRYLFSAAAVKTSLVDINEIHQQYVSGVLDRDDAKNQIEDIIAPFVGSLDPSVVNHSVSVLETDSDIVHINTVLKTKQGPQSVMITMVPHHDGKKTMVLSHDFGTVNPGKGATTEDVTNSVVPYDKYDSEKYGNNSPCAVCNHDDCGRS